MKKTINKKNEMVVDLTNITLDDVYKVFAIAKFNTMRPVQRECIANDAVDAYFDRLHKEVDDFFADMEKAQCENCTNCERCSCCSKDIPEVKAKKPNVFKRFWNWITRK